MEAVGGERPEEWARVRAVGEGVGRDVAGPAEQEGAQGCALVSLFCSGDAVQGERGGRSKRGVEGCVRRAEEAPGADFDVEFGAGEPPEASGGEPGRAGEDGQVREGGPQGGPGRWRRWAAGTPGGGPG